MCRDQGGGGSEDSTRRMRGPRWEDGRVVPGAWMAGKVRGMYEEGLAGVTGRGRVLGGSGCCVREGEKMRGVW